MAWIQIIDEDTGDLKAVYDDLTQRRGKMSNRKNTRHARLRRPAH